VTLPLAGIKVLDFSEHGFVPSGAAALADWGADVVKLERPEGDPMRQIIAQGLVADVDGYDYLFQLVNRNKRGVSIDVLAPAGREVFERLVGWADVYITNQLPRVRRKLRTEPEDLFALNPRLVVARGHGQGQRGEGAEMGGFDAVSFWSRGGIAHMLTDPSADTLASARPAFGDVPSGMFLAGGICAALVHAQRTGEGVLVDTSLLNGANWTLSPDLAYASMTGAEPPRPTASPGVRSPLGWTYRTGDRRWLMLMMLDEERYWAPACRALGREELIEKYGSSLDRVGRSPDF
jgi:crotonobetainyl-CoA:carnitine CoA-transferase CaiB-like acyl-CoA transferase